MSTNANTPANTPKRKTSSHAQSHRGKPLAGDTMPRLSHNELTATAECACFNVRKTARAVTQHFSKFLGETGLKETQFSILSVLAQTGPLPMGKLAEILVMDRTTLTRNLAPLKAKKYLETAPGKDGRTRPVQITDSGSSILAIALPQWRKAQDSLMGLFGTQDWNALRKNLDLLQSIARGEHAP